MNSIKFQKSSVENGMNEIAYLLGAMRDGYIYEKDYMIAISQKDREWLEHLLKLFVETFGVRGKIRKFRNAFELRIFSKELVDFLREYHNSSIPKIIEGNKELQISFISGFFDAEGHCTKPSTFMKTKKKKVSFHQNDSKSLEFIKNVLDEFGIKSSKVYLQKGRRCHALYIQSSDSIKKFASVFRPVRKQKELRELVSVLTP